ncbi:MAG: GlcNAc-PI de-N-acetylase family [Chloroflexi bacterium]|jgi:LmbE family N-acetylglucosaminyl deacetylase|nr:GlcNAc-PI de-N-acetylase family [Chloroflexota bacterium]
MQIAEPPEVKTIMAVAAHPDDIESWCAGTLALSIKLGASVRLLLVTSGEQGSNDPESKRETVGPMREREALEAARRLGLAEVVFLRYPDGEVEDNTKLRGELVEWIRRWRPEVLFTHDPVHPLPVYLCHRDHRVVGRVALDAVYPFARDHLAFSEQVTDGLKPYAVGQVWLFASSRPDTFVDITDGFDLKVSARLVHESQTVDPEALRKSWQERAAKVGEEVGLLMSESFTVLTIE